jgi:hypothetical protein
MSILLREIAQRVNILAVGQARCPSRQNWRHQGAPETYQYRARRNRTPIEVVKISGVGEQVEIDNTIASPDQALDQMRTDEAGASSDQNGLLRR